MAVDTYLRKKSTSAYHVTHLNGAQILVSHPLARVAKTIHVGMKRWFFWWAFDIEVEPEGGHLHGRG